MNAEPIYGANRKIFNPNKYMYRNNITTKLA